MPSDSISVTYHIASGEADVAARAEALLLEQTVELPRSALRTEFVRDQIVGRVVGIERVTGGYRVTLEQPETTAADDVAQLLNVLFGNSSLQPDVQLVDFQLPRHLVDGLKGPRFGTKGLRALTQVHGRALTATALKPMGLTAAEAGNLCGIFARAGIDIIKDDHGLANHVFCRFEDRVRACLGAVEEAASVSGRRALYVPNLIGSPKTVMSQATAARDLGARAVMVSPMLIGLAFAQELAAGLGIPIIAHPAFCGSLRISSAALLGKLFPLLGMDAVIYPNVGGRFSYTREECLAIAAEIRAPSHDIAPGLPMPAGGIRPETTNDLLRLYGHDTVLLIGGGLLSASNDDDLLRKSRHFVESVSAFPYAS